MQTNLIPRVTTDFKGNVITYNERQLEAIQMAESGKSFILMGSAGSGKTTCAQGIGMSVLASHEDVISDNTHRFLKSGMPGVLIVSFTNRAVNNIRRIMPPELKGNCITIHKALEFGPEKIPYEDAEGNERIKRIFVEHRNETRPLDKAIKTVIIEEASMVSTDLFAKLVAALPHSVRFIFIGDINQLLPVFGVPILGIKFTELPVTELVEVHRQALDSPIISLAQRLLKGKPIDKSNFDEITKPGQLEIFPWKKVLDAETAVKAVSNKLCTFIESGIYDVMQDIILCPFNVNFGTVEINKCIANYLARREGKVTYEVISGFNKLYFSVGDKVLYDREEYVIHSIEKNNNYFGEVPATASDKLDYWGVYSDAEELHEKEDLDLDAMLAAFGASDVEDRTTQTSHIINLASIQDPEESIISVNQSGKMSTMMLAYAITVHKAQGSEWRRVFFVTHKSNNIMINRELVYTAVTRAREALYIFCEAAMLASAINKQQIPGNSMAEKIQYFHDKFAKGAPK